MKTGREQFRDFLLPTDTPESIRVAPFKTNSTVQEMDDLRKSAKTVNSQSACRLLGAAEDSASAESTTSDLSSCGLPCNHHGSRNSEVAGPVVGRNLRDSESLEIVIGNGKERAGNNRQMSGCRDMSRTEVVFRPFKNRRTCLVTGLVVVAALVFIGAALAISLTGRFAFIYLRILNVT
jgi:hypothetical protein